MKVRTHQPASAALFAPALRIVAADDSAVMRSMLRAVFARHAADADSPLPAMELVGLVNDGIEALEAVERLRPDVLLLDLEMPEMGGLSVLDRLRANAPTLPVIMCSAHTAQGAQTTLEALRRGANDYVLKPSQQRDSTGALEQLTLALLPRIAALASARATAAKQHAESEYTPSEIAVSSALPAAAAAEAARPTEIIVIGVSTGGPAALEFMLPLLPAMLPVPVVIVQHMPKLFTGVLAERLDRICRLRVTEAREGDAVLPGTILLAPGDAHLEVTAAPRGMNGSTLARLHHGPALNSCKPSVDYLFGSAARRYGAATLALVLTGMGSDGVEGAREVVRAGGTVLAQDERSSAVWGMPGRVSREGIAEATLPLRSLAAELIERVARGRVQMTPGGQERASSQTLTGQNESGQRSRMQEVNYGMF